MSIEILVNVVPRETRAALLDEGTLQEVFIERVGRRGLVGNLYKGRVMRVLPGMQAAFLEIGLARTGFLHVADILSPPPDSGNDASEPVRPDTADIRTLVREGDELLVQVVKDPLGTKGARLSTHVSLPSRYMVYLPRGSRVGVSSRIESEEAREQLRKTVTGLASESGDGGGYIVRTAALDAPLEVLAADMRFLRLLWAHVRDLAATTPSGKLVHEDLPLSVRVLRDELRESVRRVLVDSPVEFARMQEFTRSFMPDFADRIELHQTSRPIFDLYGVEQEIDRALEPRVPLPSGGHIVIQQTEAMTTVDVNTGGYVGHRNLEETIFRTNLEAAVAIARQLRVRNLGGIIVLDFIDMEDPAHREALIEALKAALAPDRTQAHISSISPLGLVEMTRKRTRESLEHMLCAPCPQCRGRGFVRTPETVAHEIFRELLRQSRQFSSSELVVIAHQDVVAWMQDEEATVLEQLEGEAQRPIRLQPETQYAADQYDVVLA
jgi:ribonuclease G